MERFIKGTEDIFTTGKEGITQWPAGLKRRRNSNGQVNGFLRLL